MARTGSLREYHLGPDTVSIPVLWGILKRLGVAVHTDRSGLLTRKSNSSFFSLMNLVASKALAKPRDHSVVEDKALLSPCQVAWAICLYILSALSALPDPPKYHFDHAVDGCSVSTG